MNTTPYDSRRSLIEQLERARGTAVICYVTSTRPNLESAMAMDAIPVIYRHLAALGRARLAHGVDLLLHTNGGEGVVAWRLLGLLRALSPRVNVLVPSTAYSAGTLVALGADEVLMHPLGTLGPIDPTVNTWFNPPHPEVPMQRLGINVEDLASFFDFLREDAGVGEPEQIKDAVIALIHQVHPLALGSVKRSTLQSRMLGERLLAQSGSKSSSQINEIVERLVSELHSHGHPISCAEARNDLGLNHVVDAPDDVAELMWQLYESYAHEMKLEDAFEPVEAISGGEPLPLAEPETLFRQQRVIGPLNAVAVESKARSDVFELLFDAVLTRDVMGAVSTNAVLVRADWRRRG